MITELNSNSNLFCCHSATGNALNCGWTRAGRERVSERAGWGEVCASAARELWQLRSSVCKCSKGAVAAVLECGFLGTGKQSDATIRWWCPNMYLWCPNIHLWCPNMYLWRPNMYLWCPNMHLWCPNNVLVVSRHVLVVSQHVLVVSQHVLVVSQHALVVSQQCTCGVPTCTCGVPTMYLWCPNMHLWCPNNVLVVSQHVLVVSQQCTCGVPTCTCGVPTCTCCCSTCKCPTCKAAQCNRNGTPPSTPEPVALVEVARPSNGTGRSGTTPSTPPTHSPTLPYSTYTSASTRGDRDRSSRARWVSALGQACWDGGTAKKGTSCLDTSNSHQSL